MDESLERKLVGAFEYMKPMKIIKETLEECEGRMAFDMSIGQCLEEADFWNTKFDEDE
jgi:hypothetical protein